MVAMTRSETFRTDDRIVMHGSTWANYETQVALRGEDHRCPKLAFLDGAIELMSPSRDHEQIKWRIGQILAFYCAELAIPMSGYGQWRLADESELAGAEPDECYLFAGDHEGRSRPDLVIEVIWTSGGLDKLEIYRRLGVREVWFWDAGTIAVFGLGADDYTRCARSTFVPALDLDRVCGLLDLRMVGEIQAAVRASLV